jgi:hypothetical protein
VIDLPQGGWTVDETETLTFTVTVTDPDPGDQLTYGLVGAPPGAFIDPETGVFSWTPSENQGPGTYEFGVIVIDDGSPPLWDEETIIITINEVNNPPVANDDAYALLRDQTLTVDASWGVLGNDFDSDNDPLTASLVSSPSHGSLTFNSDGSFDYTLSGQYVGPDSFVYAVTDGVSSDTATVSLDVYSSLPTVGDYVWLDADADGFQDAGEAGLAGVTVDLLAGGMVVQSTVTDANGYYQFTLSGTAPAYQIQVVVPDGYAATALYAGPANADSNIDDWGYTESFTGWGGVSDLTLDAGLVSLAPATVGDYVWLDEDGNGIQDGDESGILGVIVNLYDVAGSLVATTTTDANGYYAFTDLAPNAYYLLEFVAPEEYDFTQQHAGSPSIASDADAYGFTDWFWVAAGATLLTLDAGLQPAAAPAEPVIEIRQAGQKTVDKLRVAKWENAFERVGDTIRVKNDFIRLDPDRFYVYVMDAAANINPAVKDTIKVKVSTTSDAGNDIVLEETDINTGRFWSKDWLLLTSVVKDDEHRVAGIADNAEGDPTFLVKLGDTVTVTYKTKTATATVPVEKVVKLHINILRKVAGGEPVVKGGIPTVEGYVKTANEIYAPVGIRFDATIQIVDPPAGVDLSNGFDEFTRLDPRGKIIMTAEEKALLGAAALRTPAKDDIEVYFVEGMRFSNGESFPVSAVPDAKYVDSIILNSNTMVYNTLPHEIGHVLMDNGSHLEGVIGVNKVNLMVDVYQIKNQVTDSRRIKAIQALDMLHKRPNLLSNP